MGVTEQLEFPGLIVQQPRTEQLLEDIRSLLGQLLELAIERREAERRMEALGDVLERAATGQTVLEPPTMLESPPRIDIMELPWYEDNGRIYVTDDDGDSRFATTDEVAAIARYRASGRQRAQARRQRGH